MDRRRSQKLLDPFCFVESLVDAKSNLRCKFQVNAARDLAAHVFLVAIERIDDRLDVMPLGGRDEKQVLGALEHNKRYVRGEIARRVNLKFAPDIRFRLDERFDEAERIEKLLRTPVVQRDLGSGKDEE